MRLADSSSAAGAFSYGLPEHAVEMAAAETSAIARMGLTMRLSDVRRREPKLIYLNHSTLLVLNEAATRRSNRLLGDRIP